MKRRTNDIKACLLGCLLVTGISPLAQETSQPWYADGQAAIQRNKALRNAIPADAVAKNVILFVGDGMGISTVTAARIFEGQLRGESGEENELSFESFPNVALSKTYNTNAQVADSAGTMTAMATGVKTDRGMISVNQDVIRGDCDSQTGNQVLTFLERAEMRGLSTGVVSTARITHATPAANYAHIMDRNFEDDRDAENLSNPGNCADIARQLIEFQTKIPGSDGLEVALGGGRQSFILREEGADPETGNMGQRLDGRDLTQEWLSEHDNSQYVWNKEQFDAIDVDSTDHLLGLFQPSHMNYNFDLKSDQAGEPSLSEMTTKAIELLSKNEKGFYLNVEAGRIDHAHHATNPQRALVDTVEFAAAVKAAVEMVDLSETLIIVTADHSHVFTIAGYPARGNPILGKVVGLDASGATNTDPALAADGLPYTTLGYANGHGQYSLPDAQTADAIYREEINAGRVDLSDIDTTDQGFHSETLVPLSDETHAGEDVAIYAIGPGSDLVRGVMEQHLIYHVMMEASQLTER
ncbi:MAG TPA: alkaline phosphatase [Porticoccaceae bacterium]|jgi:alkaline phosphatase|nr:alkaline phosphatase [Gammaproteobacteria bacterium]HIF75447.1 alkaline phosphatase [Gammaproteobacteria bacterium]HIL60726.1 alkaline phosphatase [Porticoccaceae bacterium]